MAIKPDNMKWLLKIWALRSFKSSRALPNNSKMIDARLVVHVLFYFFLPVVEKRPPTKPSTNPLSYRNSFLYIWCSPHQINIVVIHTPVHCYFFCPLYMNSHYAYRLYHIQQILIYFVHLLQYIWVVLNREYYYAWRQITFRIVRYHSSSRLTATLNLCPIDLKLLVHVL